MWCQDLMIKIKISFFCFLYTMYLLKNWRFVMEYIGLLIYGYIVLFLYAFKSDLKAIICKATERVEVKK